MRYRKIEVNEVPHEGFHELSPDIWDIAEYEGDHGPMYFAFCKEANLAYTATDVKHRTFEARDMRDAMEQAEAYWNS